jgi:hypothetical protein
MNLLLTYTPPDQRSECDEGLDIVCEHRKFNLRRWFWKRVYALLLSIIGWQSALEFHAYIQSGEDIEDALAMDEEEFPYKYLTARGQKVRRWVETV